MTKQQLTVLICSGVAMLKDALKYGHGSELSIMNALPGTKSTCNSVEHMSKQLVK